jgi:type IV fimbrial biogenesis protein FimT
MVSTGHIGKHARRRSGLAPAGINGLRRSRRGFTLIELMIGLVMVAVMLAIGVPSFRSFILNQRLRATSSDLRIALTLARSEAVKRNHAIDLKPNTGGWSKGWTIPGPNTGDPDILNFVQSGDITITTNPVNVTPEFSPAGRTATTVSFQIKVGPEANGSTGCLQLQLDGSIDSTNGACP